MGRTAIRSGPGQGSFELPIDDIDVPVMTYAPVELAPGILEGDATNIVRYLDLYVRAIKEIGRSRSNSIGFGALPANSVPVREVAYQHEADPEWQEVKDRVVASRRTHMQKAGHQLLRRAEFRRSQADYWQKRGALSKEDVSLVRFPEDAYMLEGQWYGALNLPADKEKTAARKKLYKDHERMQKAAGK
jgi:hypothetical protein